MPYPILVSLGREPNEYIMNFNSTVFELGPYEMGSWDPSLRSFMQTKYLGSSVDDGTASGKCINGFDNAGFLMGTSSSVFNGITKYFKDIGSKIKPLTIPLRNDGRNPRSLKVLSMA